MSEVSGHVVGESPLRIWGLPSALRLRRQLERAGAGEAPAGRAVLLRADWVYDQPIVRALAAAGEDCALVVDD
ncbi:MAG: CDP-alcohol phosphatidyltransferase family protein, partial [Burkholderiales bacterium]